MVGFHVKCFDITKFQGIGISSAQDQAHAHQNPLRGPPALRWDLNPLPQSPGLGSWLDDIHESIRCATWHLLRITTFVAMSSQSEQDHLRRHTSTWYTSGGWGRAAIGGRQDDPSRSKGLVPHHFSCVGINSMFPHKSMPQRATYTRLVIVLFNVIISNKFNLESDVYYLIFFSVQLFSVDFPTHMWEDTGSFNLDGAMASAEDIAAPYT